MSVESGRWRPKSWTRPFLPVAAGELFCVGRNPQSTLFWFNYISIINATAVWEAETSLEISANFSTELALANFRQWPFYLLEVWSLSESPRDQDPAGGGSPYLPDHLSASHHHGYLQSLITSQLARKALSLPYGLEAEVLHRLNDLPKVMQEISVWAKNFKTSISESRLWDLGTSFELVKVGSLDRRNKLKITPKPMLTFFSEKKCLRFKCFSDFLTLHISPAVNYSKKPFPVCLLLSCSPWMDLQGHKAFLLAASWVFLCFLFPFGGASFFLWCWRADEGSNLRGNQPRVWAVQG